MEPLEITTKKEFTITKETEGMELQLSSRPVYKFKRHIHAWVDKNPKKWEERVLYFDTDYPVVVQGDLKTRSRVNTNYPLKVKGQDLRGEF